MEAVGFSEGGAEGSEAGPEEEGAVQTASTDNPLCHTWVFTVIKCDRAQSQKKFLNSEIVLSLFVNNKLQN